MPRVFVDTGAFYAMADRSDAHHAEASQTFRERLANDELVTSDHVLVETWFLISSHLHRVAAMQFWQAMQTGIVTLLGVTAHDLWRGRAIAVDWPDQDFSIVDCTSFALIERLNIEQAFAFDGHFRTIRFGAAKKRALRILPV